MSRIVITDPHGCYDTLMALIAQLPKDVPITFAGDLIDRGPNSRKVIEFVKNGGYDCVRGNHEEMMINELEFRPDSNGADHYFVDDYNGIWSMNGGDVCLDSYYIMKDGKNVIDVAALKEHQAWLKTLPFYLEYKDLKNSNGEHLLVTHSTAAHVWGEVSPDNPMFIHSVTWDRDPYPPKIEGIYNVYGHTPQKHGATVREHFACIDTGAYFKREAYGRLTALQFPEMITYVQNNVEKETK